MTSTDFVVQLRERAAKKKPAPRYLMDKYKTGSTGKGDKGGQAQKDVRQSDAANPKTTNPGADATKSSDDPQSVLISSKAGHKRKRTQKVGGSSMTTRSKSITAQDSTLVEE